MKIKLILYPIVHQHVSHDILCYNTIEDVSTNITKSFDCSVYTKKNKIFRTNESKSTNIKLCPKMMNVLSQ